MLLGIWKNFEELEESVTLEELNLILAAGHKQEDNRNKFMAALKGINLGPDPKDKFKEIQERAEKKLRGEDTDEPDEAAELAAFGIKIEED